ncbi:MAG TPA: hypothetical protein VMY18_04300 [Acidobacteriota bacterium]|nr:hypothetical protein [Acidobacteriota bacterium]
MKASILVTRVSREEVASPGSPRYRNSAKYEMACLEEDKLQACPAGNGVRSDDA